MAKIPHEALHHLFRDDPGLFTRSVRRLFDEEFPEIREVAEINVDATSIDAVERYIDTALWVSTAKGAEFLIIEAQGEPPSKEKIRSWAWYLSFLENKYRMPASLLIVTAKKSTARECRGALSLGPSRRPAMRLDPYVIGPDNMPLITDAAQASEDVVFSVFALLAQRLNPEVKEAMPPLMSALDALDNDTARYYAEFVEGGLGEGCQREIWKQIMKTMTYGYVSELKQEFREEGLAEGREEGREEGLEEGRVEGESRMLLTVLHARGLNLTDAERERIRTCTDHDRLAAWAVRAATATSMAEVFED